MTRQLAEFMRSILPQGAEAMFQVGGADAGFAGVPVKRVATVLGRETVSEMTDATRQDIPDSLFVVPAGYTKEAFGGLGAARGRGRGGAAAAARTVDGQGTRQKAEGRNEKGRAPCGARPFAMYGSCGPVARSPKPASPS